jgi:hypothetical protein
MDEKTQLLKKSKFTFEDVKEAIAQTGVNLNWTRADTFLLEIARSRNVIRILDTCLSKGFTIREVRDGNAIGEFVPIGDPEGLENRDFLLLKSRELTNPLRINNLAVPDSFTPQSLFALFDCTELVRELWPGTTHIAIEKDCKTNSGTVSYPYRVPGIGVRSGMGLAVAFEAGNLPNRTRLARLISATRSIELAVLIPVTSIHILAARFSGDSELPREIARRVVVWGESSISPKKKTRARRGQQPSLF